MRGLAAWRAFRRLRRLVGRATGDAGRSLRLLEERTAHTSEYGDRVAAATARLQASLLTARVLADAADEASGVLARARGLVPRK